MGIRRHYIRAILALAAIAVQSTAATFEANASECGYVYGEGPTWIPVTVAKWDGAAGLMVAFATFHTGNYTFSSGMCRFNTGGIPDRASITKATLKLRIAEAPFNANLRTILFEYYPSTKWPIDGDDYTVLPIDGAYAVPVTGLHASSGTNDIDLLEPEANINKTGYTGIRIANVVGAPTGQNNVRIEQAGTQLVVTYEERRTIIITTN